MKGDDFEDDPAAMDGRRRGGSGIGMDSYHGSRGRGSLAKAEAEFKKMIGAA